LAPSQAHDGESTLLCFKRASPVGRIRLILRRIFMPQAYLALRYPCANRIYGLPLAWSLRVRDLVRVSRARFRTMNNARVSKTKNLGAAEVREALLRWLLEETKRPE
jgi:hypothetical protein